MKKSRKPLILAIPEMVISHILSKHMFLTVLGCIALISLSYQLSLIPYGTSVVERDYAMMVSSIDNISTNPLYLPHKLLSYGILELSDSVRAIRAISVLFYGVFVLALFRIIRRWHDEKVAYAATLLFATNSTILVAARLALPFVLLLGWLLVISLLLWYRQGTSRYIAPIGLFVLSAVLFFIPGSPYFAVLVLALYGRKIFLASTRIPKATLSLALATGLLLASLLVLSIVRDTTILREWLLLPDTFDLQTAGRNILRIPSAFIYRSPVNPLITIGRIPVLDVVAGGLLLIGLYAYRRKGLQERGRLIILTGLLAIVLGALGQVLSAVLIVLPFAYSIVAAGIDYIHQQWEEVFPRNPVAKSFGMILLTLLIAASVYNQLTRFLIVWPNTPQTRAVYNEQRLLQ